MLSIIDHAVAFGSPIGPSPAVQQVQVFPTAGLVPSAGTPIDPTSWGGVQVQHIAPLGSWIVINVLPPPQALPPQPATKEPYSIFSAQCKDLVLPPLRVSEDEDKELRMDEKLFNAV